MADSVLEPVESPEEAATDGPGQRIRARVVANRDDEAGSVEAAAAARMDEHVPSGADAAPVVVVDDAAAAPEEDAETKAARLAAADQTGRSVVGLGDKSRSDDASSVASSVASRSDSALMAIVVPGLADLVTKFPYNSGDPDSEKKTAAKFINDLNDYVKTLPAALGGGSRRALKRIMKKYSRRVSRSRRQRGKRVKPSAQ